MVERGEGKQEVISWKQRECVIYSSIPHRERPLKDDRTLFKAHLTIDG